MTILFAGGEDTSFDIFRHDRFPCFWWRRHGWQNDLCARRRQNSKCGQAILPQAAPGHRHSPQLH